MNNNQDHIYKTISCDKKCGKIFWGDTIIVLFIVDNRVTILKTKFWNLLFDRTSIFLLLLAIVVFRLSTMYALKFKNTLESTNYTSLQILWFFIYFSWNSLVLYCYHLIKCDIIKKNHVSFCYYDSYHWFTYPHCILGFEIQ